MKNFIFDFVSCGLACTFGLASEWYTWNPLTKMIASNWRQLRKLYKA